MFTLLLLCCSMLCRGVVLCVFLCSLCCAVRVLISVYFVIPVLFYVVPWSCDLCFPVFPVLCCQGPNQCLFCYCRVVLCCAVELCAVSYCVFLCPFFYFMLCCAVSVNLVFTLFMPCPFFYVVLPCCVVGVNLVFTLFMPCQFFCVVLCCQCESSFHFVSSMSFVTFYVVLSV